MCRLGILGAAMIGVGSLGATLQGGTLEYQIRGELTYYQGPDTALDGASFLLRATIDSNATPFYEFGDNLAQYYFDEASTSLTIEGTSVSDGTYWASTPVEMTVIDWDALMHDDFVMAPGIGTDPPFDIPGTAVDSIWVFLTDSMFSAFTDVSVPMSIDVADFDMDNSGASVPSPNGPIIGYRIDNLRITVIPEPGSLLLLALGAVAMGRAKRECFSRAHRGNHVAS